MRLTVLGWRHVPRGARASHVHWIHHAAGRWNRQGEYGALYLALHPYGALLEYAKLLRTLGVTPHMAKPRDLVSVRIDVTQALDLRHPNWIPSYPRWPSEVMGDSADSLARCRALADDAISMGNSAIRVPSSIMPSMIEMDNIIVYPHTRPANWAIDDGPDRFEISDTEGSIGADTWREIFSLYPTLVLPGMDLWLT